MTSSGEVFFVAFHVETFDGRPSLERAQVMRAAAAALPQLNRAIERAIHGDTGPTVEVSCWQAEDDRADGSDNDSAVFVPMGEQASTLEALYTSLEWEGDAAEGWS
jgi:hypothetical protein